MKETLHITVDSVNCPIRAKYLLVNSITDHIKESLNLKQGYIRYVVHDCINPNSTVKFIFPVTFYY